MSPPARTLLVVSVAVFMATLDLFIVNIAFPEIRAEWPASSLAGMSWILNAYAIVYAAFLVVAGRIADRVGRRRAFIVGLATFTAASALCAAATSVELLVAARVLQAVGAAIVTPTSLAILLHAFPPARRAAAIGAWAAIGGIAAAAGPPLGGALVEGSWRLIFLLNVPVGLAALAVAGRTLVESRDETSREWPDAAGAVLLTAAIGAVALGFVKAPEWGWGDACVVGAFLAGAVGVALVLGRSARHPSPVVDLEMLRVRSFAFANAAILAFFAAVAAMLLGGALFLTGAWGDGILRAGLSLAPGPLMAAIVAGPAGRIAGQVGAGRVAAFGSAGYAAGCAWWALRLGSEPDYAGAFLPGILLTGVGVGATLPTLAAAATASLPPTRLATGSAVFTMSRQVGAVVGVAVLVAIIGTPAPGEAADAFVAGWWFMAAAGVVAAVLALAVGGLRRTAAPTVAEARA